MRQVNFENHRLLDIIGDLKKQIERSLSVSPQPQQLNQSMQINNQTKPPLERRNTVALF